MKKSFIIFLFLLFLSFPKSVFGVDKMVFDSTDKYLGACQLTDKSEWELPSDINVTIFEVWYKWNQGETELPVIIYKDGIVFAEFTATRAQCDPYQTQWCNADFNINKLFPAGKYSTKIPNPRQCLKPNGTGAIRLYSLDTQSPSPTEIPQKIQPTTAPTIVPLPIKQTAVCSCTNNIVTAVAASLVLNSILSFVLFSRLRK